MLYKSPFFITNYTKGVMHMCKFCCSPSPINRAFFKTYLDNSSTSTLLSGHIAIYPDGPYLDLIAGLSDQIRRVHKIKFCPVCGTDLTKIKL